MKKCSNILLWHVNALILCSLSSEALQWPSHGCTVAVDIIALSFLSVALKFIWHCLNPRLQSYRMLYFRCQRKEKAWFWASVIQYSTYALFLSSALLCFLFSNFLSFLSFSAISQFIYSSYFLALILSSFLSSLLSSLTGTTPSFASPRPLSSPTPLSSERLLLESASWTQSLFYGE